MISASKTGSASRRSASAMPVGVAAAPAPGRGDRADLAARIARRREWNASPSGSVTGRSPYQLSSTPRPRRPAVRASVPARRRSRWRARPGRSRPRRRRGRRTRRRARRRHRPAPGRRRPARPATPGKPGEQRGDAAADHPAADDRDPVADQRRRVPQGVDRGLDRAGQHRARRGHGVGNGRHGRRRHDVPGRWGSRQNTVRPSSAAGPSSTTPDVEVAVLDAAPGSRRPGTARASGRAGSPARRRGTRGSRFRG